MPNEYISVAEKKRRRARQKKMVTLRVIDPRGLRRNREYLKPGATFAVDWNQSHSHVDRWLGEGRLELLNS
jgi:hypothetical protein